MIDPMPSTLLEPAYAGPISDAQRNSPIAPVVSSARKISGDGRDLTIECVEPRVIKLVAGGPQRVMVAVKLVFTVAGRSIGRGEGFDHVSCPDTSVPGTYTYVLKWTNLSNLRRGDPLRFNFFCRPTMDWFQFPAVTILVTSLGG
jgi:hypothetical protein